MADWLSLRLSRVTYPLLSSFHLFIFSWSLLVGIFLILFGLILCPARSRWDIRASQSFWYVSCVIRNAIKRVYTLRLYLYICACVQRRPTKMALLRQKANGQKKSEPRLIIQTFISRLFSFLFLSRFLIQSPYLSLCRTADGYDRLDGRLAIARHPNAGSQDLCHESLFPGSQRPPHTQRSQGKRAVSSISIAVASMTNIIHSPSSSLFLIWFCSMTTAPSDGTEDQLRCGYDAIRAAHLQQTLFADLHRDSRNAKRFQHSRQVSSSIDEPIE